MSKNKSELRRLFLNRRAKLNNKRIKELNLNQKLFNLLKKKKDFSIGGYYPVRSEIDIKKTLQKLIDLNHNISLPVILGKDRSLIFKPWKKNIPLINGEFNIKVPKTEIILKPNLLIVPLVAFNVSRFRLGYGGGFYDRTIDEYNKNSLFTIGVAFDEQESSEIPTESHDKRLNAILTPTRMIY